MENVIKILLETEAMLKGHFLLSSGRHSDKYFQCAKLLQYPLKSKEALTDIAKKISDDINKNIIKVDIVVGPAMGGIIASYELARLLNELGHNIPCCFTERDENGKMTLRRGFEVKKDHNVLIVEDVVTTGKSYLECADALISLGAKVSALSCIVDRRASDAASIELPFYPAVKVTANNWDPSVCDLCKNGIPAVKPGSRKM